MTNEEGKSKDFIREAIDADLASGRFNQVHTRFPPEPNGYLHIGHAKAIIIDYGIAEEYDGKYNLRFDDTNPTKEETEYVDAQIEDIHWLGFDWEDRLFYASDYFEQLYRWAVELIKKGKAYVDDLSADEIRNYRGTLIEPGKNSPFRDRSIEENLDLFESMKNGEFPEGSKVLRAKIDMSSPNLLMRDPVMYRILHAVHHRTGNKWCIYPMYDYAHGQSDSIEGITHSLCDIAYEIHRPLYEWFLEELEIYKPRQIEFARLNLSYTILSKRRLIRLVEEGFVNSWDDPRMPTLSGLRRRGVTPEAIRSFIDSVGIAKNESLVDYALLEYHIRQDLNKRSPRVMGVLNPIKVIITNYPEGQIEELEAINNPEDPKAGTRLVPFSREIFIERDDFMEDPPRKFFRLSPGREVRLRYGYFIKCEKVIKDEDDAIIELHCTYDPTTKGGYAPDGRKVRGTLHWVSAEKAIDAEVHLYDRLFRSENPLDHAEDEDFTDFINPDSFQSVKHCKLEPSLKNAKAGGRYQFERLGYFCVDTNSTDDNLIFNRTVTLRDTWAKIKNQSK
jgi:glutaminyl-tRNA synthetase